MADDNMAKVSKEAKLKGLVTGMSYRIFGLKQDGNNPPIMIRSGKDDIWPANDLINFFAKQKINVKTSAKLDENGTIQIGLRRDLRRHPALCAAIIQTIIYATEKRLDLKVDIKIPGIPKING
jgi:hypothetical protein